MTHVQTDVSTGVGIDVPTFGDCLNTSPNPISVGDDISPFLLGDVKHWDIYQHMMNMMYLVNLAYFTDVLLDLADEGLRAKNRPWLTGRRCV